MAKKKKKDKEIKKPWSTTRTVAFAFASVLVAMAVLIGVSNFIYLTANIAIG